MNSPGRSALPLRPRRLGPRPVIRVVAPCGLVSPHLTSLEAGIAALESANCEVRWDPTRGHDDWRGYLAGDDDRRATELIQAIGEPGVDAVWIGRGGSGGGRIASRVLEAVRDCAPRIVIGFSDATSILNGLADALNWITFHGPVVTTLGRSEPISDLDECLRVLRGEQNNISFAPQDGTPVTGRLRGGNLTVLSSMCGGPNSLEAGPADIWFLEDVQEAPYRLDRCLWQLKTTGALAGAKAVWMGNFDLDDEASHALASNFADDLDTSVFRHAPAGHLGRLSILPIGAVVTLDPRRGVLNGTADWVTDGD